MTRHRKRNIGLDRPGTYRTNRFCHAANQTGYARGGSGRYQCRRPQLDGATHVLTAAERRLDLAVPFRALRDLHFRSVIFGDAVVDEFFRALTTGHRANAHSTLLTTIECHDFLRNGSTGRILERAVPRVNQTFLPPFPACDNDVYRSSDNIGPVPTSLRANRCFRTARRPTTLGHAATLFPRW